MEYDGATPLMWAARYGRADNVDTIVQLRASTEHAVNWRSYEGVSASYLMAFSYMQPGWQQEALKLNDATMAMIARYGQHSIGT